MTDLMREAPAGENFLMSDCTDSTGWDRFVGAHTSCSYFHWYFREVVQDVFGHQPRYFVLTADTGEIVAALPLIEMKSRLFGHFAVSLPFVNYGGIISAPAYRETAVPQLVAKVEQWAQANALEHVTLRETQPQGECRWSLQDHKVAMVLTLPGTPDELMKSFKAKLRAQVRRPGKEGAVAKTGGTELVDDYYRVFSHNMRDLGTPVYSKRWFHRLLEDPGCDSRLVIVYLNSEPVAGAFLVRHGNRMEIPWASSLRKYNRFSVNMLLYWTALAYSIEQGCGEFDFGRSNRDAPTHRFKKQWGSEERPLHWYQWTPGGDSVRIDPQNSKYALATRVWQKLPIPVANAIGPHIVKSIP